MNLEMNIEERDVLCELIDRRMNELRVEIHRTESFAYRAGLEKEMTLLLGLQKRLPALIPT